METPQDTNGETPPPTPPPEMPPTAPPPPPAHDETSGPSDKDTSNRTIMIVLSYLGLLALIPLFVEKDNAEVQWHAKHGLVLMVAEFVVLVVIQILVMIVGAISGGLGCILGLLIPILCLAILAFHVYCIVKGVKGERVLIPTLSDFADRF